jgi:hypothetical protein
MVASRLDAVVGRQRRIEAAANCRTNPGHSIYYPASLTNRNGVNKAFIGEL